jgi:hypothetical protein
LGSDGSNVDPAPDPFEGIMRSRLTTAIAVLALTLAASGLALAPKWIIAGSAPADYEFATDSVPLSITAKEGGSAHGFGTLMQKLAAEDYRNGRWRLSARMRTEGASRAQMWMRVDGSDHKVLAFDNMGWRPVLGTTDWKTYQIVLDVPDDSDAIAFGFLLSGSGEVWADGFRLERVNGTVSTTAPNMK